MEEGEFHTLAGTHEERQVATQLPALTVDKKVSQS